MTVTIMVGKKENKKRHGGARAACSFTLMQLGWTLTGLSWISGMAVEIWESQGLAQPLVREAFTEGFYLSKALAKITDPEV